MNLYYFPGTGWTAKKGLLFAKYFSESFQTYMVDIPGIGRSSGIQGRINFDSMADWVKAYLDSRALEKVSLIGHSLGGAMALSFALKYPDRVKRLVLLDIGHLTIPMFPTKMFGKMGYFIPLISLIERIIGPGKEKNAQQDVPNRKLEDIK